MNSIRIYKILAGKFSEEEAINIMEYIESAKTSCTGKGPGTPDGFCKLREELHRKFHKLHMKITIGLVIVMAISIILTKALAQAVIKREE